MKNYLLFLSFINIMQAAESTIVTQPSPARWMGDYSRLTDEQRKEVDRNTFLTNSALCGPPGAACLAGASVGLALSPSLSLPAAIGYSLLVGTGVHSILYPCYTLCIRRNRNRHFPWCEALCGEDFCEDLRKGCDVGSCAEPYWVRRINDRAQVTTGNASS